MYGYGIKTINNIINNRGPLIPTSMPSTNQPMDTRGIRCFTKCNDMQAEGWRMSYLIANLYIVINLT